MIRINLLEGTRREFDVKPETASSSAFPAKVFGVTILAAGLLLAAAYGFITHRLTQLGKQLAVENAEAARLAVIRTENLRYEVQLRDIERRMAAVQTLQDNRQGPTRLMTLVAAAVNRAPGLYLQSVTPKEDRLQMSGTSRSVTSVAGLVAALETTANIHDVELREYYQDDDKDGRVDFRFNLDFVYQPAGGAAVPKPVAGPASAARPAPARGI